MALANPSWHLTPGATYHISYQVDQQSPLGGEAAVVRSDLAEVALLDSTALFRAFQRGHLLTVQAAGQTFYFDLKDSGKALAATLSCAQSNVAASGTGTNPFAAPVTPAPQAGNQPSQAAFRAEAAALAANLLSSAGVQGFQIVSEIPADLASTFHSMWTAPGLVGGVVVSPDGKVDEGVSLITANSASNCKGKFGVTKIPVTGAGADVKTLCETAPGTAQVVSYLIFPRPAGGVYVFSTSDVSDGTTPDNAPSASTQTAGANVEATSARLMEASIRVLGH
jgi:hypothetical protein